jgi:pimeloyl-ACP methyl ester carboxylesterase
MNPHAHGLRTPASLAIRRAILHTSYPVPRKHADDLRAASRLVVDATRSITIAVEEMHHAIASGPPILGRPLAWVARPLLRMVYEPIRVVTDLVGAGIDVALSQLEPLLGESTPGPEREALLAALNGVLGDYLHTTGSPLAIAMMFRHEGRALSLEARELSEVFPNAGGKLLVLVHGSSASDLQWNRDGHDHGAALARDLGYTPVYLHYNSGLHISTNGRELALLLERLARAWPAPVEEVGILGHSMGGLVARSACHTAEVENLSWRRKLRRLVFLGCPHHGSPLEQYGHWLHTLLGVSAYSTPIQRLARIRSAGITDMRFGSVLDEHWHGRDRFEHIPDPRRNLSLPDGIDCYAIAGTTAKAMAAKLPGDGLVPVDSALGRHKRPDLTLAFPESHQWIALGTGHLDLLSKADVYEKLREWLGST